MQYQWRIKSKKIGYEGIDLIKVNNGQQSLTIEIIWNEGAGVEGDQRKLYLICKRVITGDFAKGSISRNYSSMRITLDSPPLYYIDVIDKIRNITNLLL